jgi:anti-anti-sigma factor
MCPRGRRRTRRPDGPRGCRPNSTRVRRTRDDVVIDLRKAVFIDSAGLHILLNAHRRLARAGRQLRVVCGDGPVKLVIELARLTETLCVVPDENPVVLTRKIHNN